MKNKEERWYEENEIQKVPCTRYANILIICGNYFWGTGKERILRVLAGWKISLSTGKGVQYISFSPNYTPLLKAVCSLSSSSNRNNTSVADPGCLSRIRVFSHPGSGFFPIPDPGSQKTWGGKKFFYISVFLPFCSFPPLLKQILTHNCCTFYHFWKTALLRGDFFFLKKKFHL